MLSPRFPAFLLAFLFLVVATPATQADDASFGEDSVIVLSVDDWQTFRTDYRNSDWGQFLREPSIRETLKRFSDGIGALVSGVSAPYEEDSEEGSAPGRMMGVVGEQFAMLLKTMTGRCAISIGYQMTPMGPMPNILLECHGPEEIAAMKKAILGAIKTEVSEPLMPANFMVGEMGFEGVEGMPGVGLYFGRNGDHFAIGTSRSGLKQYFDTEGTSVGARFGSTPVYQAGKNLTTSGNHTSYLNFDPIWKLIPFFTAMAGGPEGTENDEDDGDAEDADRAEDDDDWGDEAETGFPDVAAIIDAFGLTTVHGSVGRWTMSADGASSESIIAIHGRKGIMGLIPRSNVSLAIPRIVPGDAAAVSMFRFAFDQVISIAKEIFIAVEGEEGISEFEAGLQMMSEQMGINIQEVLDSIEGTIASYTPARDPDAPPMNPMMMMMGGGTGIDTFMMVRLKDTAPMEKVIETLAGPEMMGATLQRKEIAGHEVFVYDPLGDTPAEFAPPSGPALKPAITFDGNWFVFSSSEALLTSALESDSGGIASRPDFKKLIDRVGGTDGLLLAYADLGDVLAQQADIIRPMLGFLPLLIPDIGSNEELSFLFDTDNVPSSDLIRKFFGPGVSRSEIIPGGIRTIGWYPRVVPLPQEKKSGSVVEF